MLVCGIVVFCTVQVGAHACMVCPVVTLVIFFGTNSLPSTL